MYQFSCSAHARITAFADNIRCVYYVCVCQMKLETESTKTGNRTYRAILRTRERSRNTCCIQCAMLHTYLHTLAQTNRISVLRRRVIANAYAPPVCVYMWASGCYNSRKNCVFAATCPQYIVVVARAVLTVLLTGKNPVRELKYYSVVSHLHILGTIISVLNDQNHRRVCTAFSPGDICRTVVGEVCLFHSVPGARADAV